MEALQDSLEKNVSCSFQLTCLVRVPFQLATIFQFFFLSIVVVIPLVGCILLRCPEWNKKQVRMFSCICESPPYSFIIVSWIGITCYSVACSLSCKWQMSVWTSGGVFCWNKLHKSIIIWLASLMYKWCTCARS